MKIKVNNYWTTFDWNLIKKSGHITFFDIVWHFDNYCQVLWIIIFNFEIEIYWS